MYFVYQKQINLASKYIYSTEEIVNWFIKTWDISTTFEDLGDTATPRDLVDDIFNNPDCWYDDFVRDMALEDDIIENLSSEDLSAQIQDVIENQLLEYYKEHWEDLKNEQDISNS